ncbi:MAG: hypothetical protein CL878_10215 [Dehalococcoidia bacterium]|nr:hypothetical protein [Dehalococcoidia bacterium]
MSSTSKAKIAAYRDIALRRYQHEVLATVSSQRRVLLSGGLAGFSVFVAPLALHAIAVLLAILLASVIAVINYFAYLPELARAVPVLDAGDFRSVFAPLIAEAPLLVYTVASGMALAVFRRWQNHRRALTESIHTPRPQLPILALCSVLSLGGILYFGLFRSVYPEPLAWRVIATVVPLMTLAVAWFVLVVWQYAYRNWLDLLASPDDRRTTADVVQREELRWRAEVS